MPFHFKSLEIPDLILIEPRVFHDERGFFLETYQRRVFEEAGIPAQFVQDNLAHSRKGVLRGLHYQADPMAQGKLVWCLRGEIFDVAVDLRQDSPTFGRWIGQKLSAANRLMLWIPRGFAHGYVALAEENEVFYKVDQFYSPAHERGIRWNDPDLQIAWPVRDPMVSSRDDTFPGFREVHGLPAS